METLTDVDLAIISPKVPLEEILEYRHAHGAELGRVREELGCLDREIQQNPWDEGFQGVLESKNIPQIQKKLLECKKARDSWFKTVRGRKALKLAGLSLGAAASVISLVFGAAPLLPVAVVTAALKLTSSKVIPSLELALDWKNGKQEASGNGLHYLLTIKDKPDRV